ncbi:MAG: hypothetical protein ABW128_06800 [Rhizorhabdus sp.]
MSGDKIKVETTITERSDEQAARAAPVSLPAGSFDADALRKDLDETAKAKNDDKRDALVEDVVSKHHEAGTKVGEPGLTPGYKRVEVENVDLGITESRIVYDPSKAKEAEAAQADAPVAIQPGAADAPGSKGE